ncbi:MULTISPECIES: hypothetical protein [Nocardia]|uniref:hypothetical protein n=1 Tax=Nocardia TaxID=1817 RepID=UPI0018953922|nr:MULTISPECIES: hypothetical protein [Nocardia]MBF6348555.1 hypothetical protein [Nocardia flavorosea]
MSGPPIPVRVAAAGTGIHAINHLIVPLIPPTSWHVGTVYHLISAPLYAALLVPLLRGRNWARVLVTVLLACQFGGRFVVWLLFPGTAVHLALLAGWTLSVVVLAALWVPRSARAYFRRRPADRARTS